MSKKIIAILLSAVLMFTLVMPAFAADNTQTPFEDSRFFEYGDYSIHYRVWEAENETAKIFMIHGFALSSYCWEKLATILVANGYTCVLADLPDFGYSSRETASTELLPREDIMYELMMSIDDGEWYVAGHSMGGYIALAMGIKHPETVKNLLLYGTSGNSGVSESLLAMMKNPVFAKIMGVMMQYIAGMDIMVRMFLAMGLNDPAYATNYDLSKISDPLRIDGTGIGAVYSFSMLTKTDFYAVQHLNPILYMNGNKDKVINEADRTRLRKYLPENSVDYTVIGGGHMFIENKAEEVAGVTLDFLAANA